MALLQAASCGVATAEDIEARIRLIPAPLARANRANSAKVYSQLPMALQALRTTPQLAASLAAANPSVERKVKT